MKGKDIIVLQKIVKYCNEIAWGTIETDVPYLKMKCESLLK